MQGHAFTRIYEAEGRHYLSEWPRHVMQFIVAKCRSMLDSLAPEGYEDLTGFHLGGSDEAEI